MNHFKNIVITGYMGTGKTSVGILLAQQLGWQFVDMDDVIEAREKRPIKQIFADDGEPYFREVEAQVCRDLAAQDEHVIATGGGALVDERNLAAMVAERNLVICLDASPDVLWQRLSTVTNRPMLGGVAEKERLVNLWHRRQAAYARIPYHVDTDHRSVADIAAEILRLLNTPAS